MKPHSKKANKGFTLIEMLIVVAIIGILSSTILVGLGDARKNARDAKRIADVRQVQNGLENYYAVNQKYPRTNDLYKNVPALPYDPQSTDLLPVEYGYSHKSGGQGYVLGACLEKDRAENIANFSSRDDIGSCFCDDTNAYCVSVDVNR